MGTDIHNSFEKKVDDKWVDVELSPEYDFNRNYLWFAILGDVRNGYGFGGVETFRPVEPIAADRGLPDDIDVEQGGYGDHSYSWVMLEEILDYFKTNPTTSRCGIITKSEYDKWNEVSSPNFYSGGVGGPGVKVFDATTIGDKTLVPLDITHVKVRWFVDIAEELSHYHDLIKKAYKEHGNLRMTFGFDS